MDLKRLERMLFGFAFASGALWLGLVALTFGVRKARGLVNDQ